MIKKVNIPKESEEILRAMRYILIDKITELKTGEQLTGVKNVTFSDALARPFGATFTPLPAAFVLEAMAQAAGLLVAATIECRAQPVLSKVQRMKIEGRAEAGERVEVFASLRNLNEAGARVSVKARSEAAMRAEAEVFLSLVSFDALTDTNADEHRRDLQKRLASLFPGWFAETKNFKTAI